MTEQQFTPPSTVFMKWKLADEGQLRIQKWSQLPFDGAISYAMSAEDATGATPTPETIVVGIETHNDEAGYVEFINSDVPYIVRDLPSPAAILIDMETRQYIGYRVYEPKNSPVPSSLPIVKAICQHCERTTVVPKAVLEAALKDSPSSIVVGIETHNDEAGYVEFINSDVPYIVRDLPSPAAILIDMETRQYIGYRVYEPKNSPVPSSLPIVKAICQHCERTTVVPKAVLEAALKDSPSSNVGGFEDGRERAARAAEAYVSRKGYEHSGGIIEAAFESGVEWSLVSSDNKILGAEMVRLNEYLRGWLESGEDATMINRDEAQTILKVLGFCEDEGCDHHGTPHVCIQATEGK
ncbi:hypothetical protein EQW76_00520 [Rhizobium sp. rho-13.1]|uniref:hypothetical protein n=1 Tax=Rhizobium sp. rho-13.1 TaxID=2506431 RepID=UPI00115C9641|nr:hypothetical protein [Rhizobium sp. rho-13.1]TQX91259.1 hypothetical protein EQW76_00520 [Rhizobium sp. rho-13.1]